MHKKTVVVLFGGQSAEHEVSRNSAAMVISHMDEEKYFVLPLGITKAGQWLLYHGPVEHIKTGAWETYSTPAFISPDATKKCVLKIVGDKIKEIPIDVVFPVLHGTWGEDGTIQGLLELAQIPYVGAGVAASSICMDKVFTKIIASHIGIQQAPYLWFPTTALEHMETVIQQVEKTLPYPCFVKPANTGSSVGISKVNTKEELEKALHIAASFDKKVIVEKGIVGREVECAVLGNEQPNVSGVGEIFAAAEFYDYDAKYNNAASKTVVPADLAPEIVAEIQAIALKIFKAVDGEELARIDFFIEEGTNQVILNELNTMPGFTTISMYPMLWEAEGKPKTELIDDLITLALSKEQKKG